jgi:protein SCO1/2
VALTLRNTGRLVLVLAITFGIAGCSHSAETPQAAKKKYPVVGKVVASDRARNRITVQHQEIPGFMDAMTMSYDVKDPKEMKDLEPGDEIHCDLIVDGSELWLQKIVVTKKHAEIPEGKS